MRRHAGIAALAASTLLGGWIFVSPELLGLDGITRVTRLVVGPLVMSVSVIAFSPAVRTFARANLLLGLVLVASPLFPGSAGWIDAFVVGLLVALFSLVPVSEADRFGGGWLSLGPHREDG